MNPVNRIKDLQKEDRPRERLANVEPSALSNAQLIGIFPRSGLYGINAVQLGQRLLSSLSGLNGLHRASIQELKRLKGIGRVKASQLRAAIELGRRLATHNPEERLQIQSPEDVAELLQYEMGLLEQEHLRVLLLDARNRLIRITEVYRGTLNSSHIRVGEVFRDAVCYGAAAVIVAHNHPSGVPRSM